MKKLINRFIWRPLVVLLHPNVWFVSLKYNKDVSDVIEELLLRNTLVITHESYTITAKLGLVEIDIATNADLGRDDELPYVRICGHVNYHTRQMLSKWSKNRPSRYVMYQVFKQLKSRMKQSNSTEADELRTALLN